MAAARQPHHFIGIDPRGQTSVLETAGNEDTHIILRGSRTGANYRKPDIVYAAELLKEASFEPAIMVDCSHGNSDKHPERQEEVLASVLATRRSGCREVIGFMLESNLKEGRQAIPGGPRGKLEYGVSITDACIGWETTERLLGDGFSRPRDCDFPDTGDIVGCSSRFNRTGVPIRETHGHPCEDRPRRTASDRHDPAADRGLLLFFRDQRHHRGGQGVPGLQGRGAGEVRRPASGACWWRTTSPRTRHGGRHPGGHRELRGQHRAQPHGGDLRPGRATASWSCRPASWRSGPRSRSRPRGAGRRQEAGAGHPADRRGGPGGQGLLVRALRLVPGGERAAGHLLQPGQPDHHAHPLHPGRGHPRPGSC